MKILNRFQDNNICHHCRNDETIKLIGRNLWLKKRGKIDKEFQVRKSVMADMRGLSELFIEFQDCMTSTGKGMVSDAQEIFKKDNWDELREAIDKVTKKKYGKKNGLYYLLLRSADILQGHYLFVSGAEKVRSSILDFIAALKSQKMLYSLMRCNW